ncbi:MAG: Tim44-like domain-containing protein [Bacillota bacterium]
MKTIRYYVNAWVLLGFLKISSSSVFARGGGGGHGGGGGGHGGGGGSHGFGGGFVGGHAGGAGGSTGPWTPFDYLLIIIFFLMVAFYIWYKTRTSQTVAKMLRPLQSRWSHFRLQRHAAADINWDKQYLIEVVTDTYFKAQDAWAKHDNRCLRDCMTERLQEEWQDSYRDMDNQHEHNILKDIRLLKCEIIKVSNPKYGISAFTAYILGEMIDYTVDTETNEVVDGNKSAPTRFEEEWRFIRHSDGWLLDRITHSRNLKRAIDCNQ